MQAPHYSLAGPDMAVSLSDQPNCVMVILLGSTGHACHSCSPALDGLTEPEDLCDRKNHRHYRQKVVSSIGSVNQSASPSLELLTLY